MKTSPLLALALLTSTFAHARGISGPMVVSDAWPQATDLASWARDVLRIEGKTDAPDRDKALALYYWTRLFVMSPSAGTEPYEGPFGQEGRLVEDVHKVMFVHGCGDCDYQARALEAVWALYKGDDRAARRVNWMPRPHTMAELKWDGAWHAFDVMNGIFFLDADSPTANVLSIAQEIDADDLLKANEHFEHRCRPFFERVRSWEQPGEWRMHLEFTGFYETGEAWVRAGSPDGAVFATHSMPSTLPLSDMNWYLPRGARIERRWAPGPDFYAPQAQAASFGALGRHFRQALEWPPSDSHWNGNEDLYNFPKVEPYLRLCTDPDDIWFYGQHTLYLTSAGTYEYEADLWSDAYLDAVEGEPGLVRATAPPFLRPGAAGEPRSITFRIRSPYIMGDATLAATVAAGPGDAARFLLSTDAGETWDEVASGEGRIEVNLGKARFDGVRQSVSGKYEYLVRFECEAARDPATVGLSRMRLTTRIDGSLNALPRLAAGANTVRFKVSDARAVEAPIRVEYRWGAGTAPGVHTKDLRPEDFGGNEVAWRVEAPDLTRCESYAFSYGGNDEDGNGLPDTWERHYFGAIGQDPAGDPDGDGVANRDELDAGTVPTPGGPFAALSGPRTKRGCGACSSGGASLFLLLLGVAWGVRAWSRWRGRPRSGSP